MTSSGSSNSRAAHDARRLIDAEHRQLRHLLVMIGATAKPAAMVPLLEQLKALLEEHFAHEEADGGMPSMVSGRAPHLMTQLGSLMNEHEVFMSDVSTLIERAARGDEVDAVHAAFRDLASRLHDHESRETDLIMDAFESDLGGGD
jgi:hemerythrin